MCDFSRRHKRRKLLILMPTWVSTRLGWENAAQMNCKNKDFYFYFFSHSFTTPPTGEEREEMKRGESSISVIESPLPSEQEAGRLWDGTEQTSVKWFTSEGFRLWELQMFLGWREEERGDLNLEKATAVKQQQRVKIDLGTNWTDKVDEVISASFLLILTLRSTSFFFLLLL